MYVYIYIKEGSSQRLSPPLALCRARSLSSYPLPGGMILETEPKPNHFKLRKKKFMSEARNQAWWSLEPHIGTSLMRKRNPLGPYRRRTPRILGWS